AEPALRHAPMQRHLAALEPALEPEPRPRLRTLVAARRRLAVSRPGAAAYPLLRLLRPTGRPQVVQSHLSLQSGPRPGLFVDADQVPHLEDEAARGRRVDHVDRLPDPPQAEGAQRLLLRLLEADPAPKLSNL